MGGGGGGMDPVGHHGTPWNLEWNLLISNSMEFVDI